MARIDYDLLDEEYESQPRIQRIPRKPVGSLTDQARLQTPQRDGAHKRDKELNG